MSARAIDNGMKNITNAVEALESHIDSLTVEIELQKIRSERLEQEKNSITEGIRRMQALVEDFKSALGTLAIRRS